MNELGSRVASNSAAHGRTATMCCAAARLLGSSRRGTQSVSGCEGGERPLQIWLIGSVRTGSFDPERASDPTSRQAVDQGPGSYQVGSVEALGEPVEDRED